MRRRDVCLSLLLTVFFAAGAEASVSPKAEVRPLVSTVAGTLSPFVLSINGKVILREKNQYESLFVNGKPIKLGEGKKRTFFAPVNKDTIEIVVVDRQGRKRTFPPIGLPVLFNSRVKDKLLLFTFTRPVRKVSVDSQPLSQIENEWAWSLPALPEPAGNRHLVRADGNPGSPGRNYNLHLVPPTVAKPALVPKRSLSSVQSLGLRLAAFQLGAVAAMQSTGSNAFTAEGWWTPTYLLSERWALRIGIGVLPLQSAPSGYFLAAQYEADVIVRVVGRLALEAGGGAQTWFGNGGGTWPLVSVNLALGLRRWGQDGFFQRIYLGYSNLFAATPTHVVRLGIGIQF